MFFLCTGDAATLSTARGRLAEPDGLSSAQLMERGLAARHRAGDVALAVDYFREILARQPTHYGATYQLAAALDAQGRPEAARPLWQRFHQWTEPAAGGNGTPDDAR